MGAANLMGHTGDRVLPSGCSVLMCSERSFGTGLSVRKSFCLEKHIAPPLLFVFGLSVKPRKYFQRKYIIIINGYAPTKNKNKTIEHEFYERLHTVYTLLPNSELQMLLGHFKTKIGQQPVFNSITDRNSLYKNSNDNGKRLMNFVLVQDTAISSTDFPYIHRRNYDLIQMGSVPG